MFSVDEARRVVTLEPLDLPKTMAIHGYRGGNHPVDSADVLITAGCGEGFRRRMSAKGIRVLVTSESDPQAAVHAVAMGKSLPPVGSRTLDTRVRNRKNRARKAVSGPARVEKTMGKGGN